MRPMLTFPPPALWKGRSPMASYLIFLKVGACSGFAPFGIRSGLMK